MPSIQSLTDFRKNTTAMVNEVNETGSALYLTQNGKAAAVVVSPKLWEETQNSLAMLQLLTMREQEPTHSFDVVMNEIDAMLEAHDGK